jgi:endogenous inhibitor of DNA gyrase (YacG/DUF329 family)
MFSRMGKGTICPTCKGPVAAATQNAAHPFCSGRCKLADLSNWFNERYTVPAEPVNPDEIHEDEGPKLLH